MNMVLTGCPPQTKALLSPGTLPTQSPATLTHHQPPAAPVPIPTPQPPLWDIHALVQAQAQAQAQAQVQAQAQALRNQDFWLMALASNPPPTSTSPASPPASNATSKALALPAPAQHQIPSYAMTPQHAAAAFHAAQQPQAPFLLFNVPSRYPIIRAQQPHTLMPSIIQAPINPTALMGLKRSWESAFPTDPATAAAAANASKRTPWQTPAAAAAAAAAAFPTPAAAHGLTYPAQFYPQI